MTSVVGKVNALASVRLRAKPTNRKAAYQLCEECKRMSRGFAKWCQRFVLNNRNIVWFGSLGMLGRDGGQASKCSVGVGISELKLCWPNRQKKQGFTQEITNSRNLSCGLDRRNPTLRPVEEIRFRVYESTHAQQMLCSKPTG